MGRKQVDSYDSTAANHTMPRQTAFPLLLTGRRSLVCIRVGISLVLRSEQKKEVASNTSMINKTDQPLVTADSCTWSVFLEILIRTTNLVLLIAGMKHIIIITYESIPASCIAKNIFSAITPSQTTQSTILFKSNHCAFHFMHSFTYSTSFTGSFIQRISILWIFFIPYTKRAKSFFCAKVRANPLSLCRPVRPTLCKQMSKSISASFQEYLGGPTLITKQAFLISIPLAMMLVAHRMLVSLFLNLDIISLFSLIVISIFLPSSYFLAAIIPKVKGLRYSAQSEVKSEACIAKQVLLL